MADEIFAHWRWKGSDPKEGNPGVLRIEPDGSMELNMLVNLPEPDGKPDLILGRDKSGQFFSLTGLFLYGDFGFYSDSGPVTKVSVNQLLEGCELSTADEPAFDQLHLSFRNLLGVRNASNWTTVAEPDDSNPLYPTRIQENVEPLRASTERGELELHVGWGTNDSFTQGEYTVYDQASYFVQLPSTTSLDGCTSPWYRPLMDLTSFMAQRSCAPLYVRASGPDFIDRGHQDWITVRGRWFNLNDGNDDPINWREAISNFSEEPGEFERLINKWLDLHADLYRSLSTYFINEWEKVPFVETRLINAAIAAEGYHRCVHDEPKPKSKKIRVDFRERITALAEHAEELIGNDLFGEEFVSRVVKARNALAHHDKDSAEKAPSDTLRVLADTLQAILTICIADHLGLDMKTCKERMKWKLNWLKSEQNLLKEDTNS